jgi:hypothetical protein
MDFHGGVHLDLQFDNPMKCAIYAKGPGAEQRLVECENWGFKQEFPPMAVCQTWDELLQCVREGNVQCVVLGSLGDCEDVMELAGVVVSKGAFLVSLGDEVDTRPYGQVQSGQGRMLEGMARWWRGWWRDDAVKRRVGRPKKVVEGGCL